MKRIKKIVDLWFDQSEEAICRRRGCDNCPFFFQVNPENQDAACKTIWLLFERAQKNLK
jgi:hypothetical protein